jgi:hypothetical protein
MTHAGPKPAVRSFFFLVALGAAGVVAALPVSLALVREALAALPDAPTLSPATTFALALVNPLVLVAVATLAGLVFAPRVGLRSLLAEWAAGRPFGAHAWRSALPVALAVGAAVGAILVVLDALTATLLVGELAGQTVTADRSLAVTVAGVLYGGVTEEILLRWGLMSLLAWAFALAARLLAPVGTGATAPPPTAMAAAIVVSALLFGLAHLPALAAQAELTAGLVGRTVFLNALGGVAFGVLFWRRHLEAAMVAHATAHVVISLIAWVVPGV